MTVSEGIERTATCLICKSATAACYVVIETLSSNLINKYGPKAIESLISRLNVFQTALISNLEKFRYR